MKALIRNDEILTEQMRTDYINWADGMPLTNPDWNGGAYTLVENLIPPAEDEMENPTAESNIKRITEIAELKARLAALEKEV